MKFLRLSALCCSLLLFVEGCSSEKETMTERLLDGSNDVISAVNAASSVVRTFSADGSISVASPRITQSAGFRLDVKRPDSVKLVIEGPFGITVARAVFTKEHFIAYSALQNSVYEGNTDAKSGFIKMIDVPPALIIDALAGIRRFAPDETSPDSFSVSGRNYRLQFFSNRTIKRYGVDISSNRIVSVETLNRENGTLLWRESYEYERTDSSWDPLSVTITVPEKQTTVEIVYNSVSINPDLSPLTIAVPEDAERIHIE